MMPCGTYGSTRLDSRLELLRVDDDSDSGKDDEVEEPCAASASPATALLALAGIFATCWWS